MFASTFFVFDAEKHPQDTGNSIAIAEQQFAWVQKGHNFLKKGEDQIYTFDKMTDTSGVFTVLDMWGKSNTVNVPHKGLKVFRPTEKEAPKRLDSAALGALSLSKSQTWLAELQKAEVQAAVLKHCMEHLGCFQFSANKGLDVSQ